MLCLISGGASALLALPAPGLTLGDKQAVNRALLKSGANIVEMNTVRKHLSAIKGGRLAVAAQPARVLSWLISDVPNDDPGVIGSGPTVPDRTTFADALAVLAKYRIDPPAAVRAHLEKGAAGGIEETPKPGDPRLARVETIVVATPQRSLEAAAAVARKRGLEVVMLGDNLEGEARELGARACTRGDRARKTRRQADRDPVRRRDHGHGARQGPRRAQRRISSGQGHRRKRRGQASGGWPPIPTASTAPRTSRAASSRPIRSPAPAPWAVTPRPCWTTMTGTASSKCWVTALSQARPRPTSTISGQH